MNTKKSNSAGFISQKIRDTKQKCPNLRWSPKFTDQHKKILISVGVIIASGIVALAAVNFVANNGERNLRNQVAVARNTEASAERNVNRATSFEAEADFQARYWTEERTRRHNLQVADVDVHRHALCAKHSLELRLFTFLGQSADIKTSFDNIVKFCDDDELPENVRTVVETKIEYQTVTIPAFDYAMPLLDGLDAQYFDNY